MTRNYLPRDREYAEVDVLIGSEEARLVEKGSDKLDYGQEYSKLGEVPELDDTEDYEREMEGPASGLEETAAHIVAGSITSGFMVLESGAQATFSTLEAIAKALD